MIKRLFDTYQAYKNRLDFFKKRGLYELMILTNKKVFFAIYSLFLHNEFFKLSNKKNLNENFKVSFLFLLNNEPSFLNKFKKLFLFVFANFLIFLKSLFNKF